MENLIIPAGGFIGAAIVGGIKELFNDDGIKKNSQVSNNNGGNNNHQCQNYNMGNASQVYYHNQTYQNGNATYKSERIEIKFFPK